MINMNSDPIWEMMDFFVNPFQHKISNRGLSNISKPHNLTNVLDNDGNVIAQKLTVVTTPFSKEDVKVKLIDNTLSVQCGTENAQDIENEKVIYRGISSHSCQFALKLGNMIDKSKIKAVNKDGLLTIDLPYVVKEDKKPEEIDIIVG